MKKLTLILSLVLMVIMQVQAQNSKVTSGVIAFDAGRYEEAVEKLTVALENKDQLKEKNIPKAHYYLSQAYLRVGQDTALIKQYPDALLKSYDHLELAKETDASGKYKKQATLAETMVWPTMFNIGATAYNQKDYESSLAHFERAVKLSPDDVNTIMMLGYSQYMMKDTTNALTTWQRTIDAYEKLLANATDEEPVEPNKDIAAAYLLVGSFKDLKGDIRGALEAIQAGRKNFPNDKELQRTELSLYQKSPELFAEAESKFQKAIEENPDDLIIQLAYAGMLKENGQVDRALALYNGVLAKDPDNLQANIQIGAHHVNVASEKNDAKMKLSKESEIDAADKEVSSSLKKAYPYMQKLHKLQPTEPEWINQLVSISLFLGLDKEAEEYMKIQQEVMKGQGN